jgi:1,4-dihydroxy-6-naphthoate synthase
MSKTRIRVGHSPDADDAFMFYGLAAGKIDTGDLEIVQVLDDIESLNRRARDGELEVTALSIHAYPSLSERYALLPSGASMGDGYGPRVLTREPMDRETLAAATIAVPGRMTSAFLALGLYLGGSYRHEVLPFDQIPDAVQEGRFDAGLVIHEGQLTYHRRGLHLLVDLGDWWKERTGGLPLPLGGNAVRRDLRPETIRQVAGLLEESIRTALENRQAALDYALDFARELSGDRELTDEFVGMYVNHWTLDYGERGREAIERFLTEGHEAGLVPQEPRIEFLP